MDGRLFFGGYLKGAHFPQPRMMQISEVKSEEVDGKQRLVVYFTDEDKGLLLNVTNFNVIAGLYTHETDNWTGQNIVLLNDPTITYKGELTGGIRVRPVQQPAGGYGPPPPPPHAADPQTGVPQAAPGHPAPATQPPPAATPPEQLLPPTDPNYQPPPQSNDFGEVPF